MTGGLDGYLVAGLWRALGDGVLDARALAGGAVESLRGNNCGDAVDALVGRWEALADPSHGVLTRLADLCVRLAEECAREA